MAAGLRASARGAGDALEEQARRGDAQALARAAEGGAVRCVLVVVEAAGLEDLADGHLGEEAHGQDHLAGDLEGEGASAGVEAAGVLEDLQDVPSGITCDRSRSLSRTRPACPGGRALCRCRRLVVRFLALAVPTAASLVVEF
jgi:hypothetical protein